MAKYILVCGLLMAASVVFSSREAIAESAELDVVIAGAADVQAIVVRDGQGRLRRYARGDVVTGSEWRIASVRDDEVIFENLRREMGARIEMRIRVGEAFRLHAPPAQAQLAIPVAVHARKAEPAGNGSQ
jgi:type II secretory pathway component PulC